MKLGRKLSALALIVVMGAGLAGCTSEPTPPPKPTATQTVDPENALFSASRDWRADDRGVKVTDEQRAAFEEAVLMSADINYRMSTEGLSDTFLWNVAYIGATAPKAVLTDEVLSADLSGMAKDSEGNTDLFGGAADAEFMDYVSEETGIPKSALYFHVVAHIAQLGAIHLR